MAKESPSLRVEFRDLETGTELGHSELPMDALPARFGKEHGLTLWGEKFAVMDTRPGSRKDWVKKGKVVLLLKPLTAQAMPNLLKKLTPPPAPVVVPVPKPLGELEQLPEAPALTDAPQEADTPKVASHPAAIPRLDKPLVEATFRTRCGFLPKAGDKAPSSPLAALSLLPADWRQVELIGKGETMFLDAELDALRNSSEHYVRMAIKQPLASQFTVQEFVDAVFPGADMLEGVVIQGEDNMVEDSFALRAREGAEAYGTHVAGFVFMLAFKRFPTHTDALERLTAFLKQHDLVLVQWVRGRVLRELV